MQSDIWTAFVYSSHRTTNFNVWTAISTKRRTKGYTIQFCVEVEHAIAITDDQDVCIYRQRALDVAVQRWSPKNQSIGIKSELMSIWRRSVTDRWRPWRNIWEILTPLLSRSMYWSQGKYFEFLNQLIHNWGVTITKIPYVKHILVLRGNITAVLS